MADAMAALATRKAKGGLVPPKFALQTSSDRR